MSRHRQSGSKGRRSSRVFGAGTAIGAFLAFGMSPLGVQSAHADFDDVLIELFGEGLGDALTTLSADWADQDAWQLVLDPDSWSPFFDNMGDPAVWDLILSDLDLSGVGVTAPVSEPWVVRVVTPMSRLSGRTRRLLA